MAGVRLLAAAAVVGAALLTMSATAGGAGLGPVKTTPGFASALQSMAPDATFGGFVIFNGGSRASHAALLATHHLTATADFQSSVNAVYAVGTVADLRALTYESAAVKYLEEDRRLAYHGETGPWATRARVAQEEVSGGPFYDAAGRTLDGTGVGVAIIDSGVNAAHPDLEDRVAHNYKIVCSTPGLVDSETGLCFGTLAYLDVGSTNSDLTSGHGTHVSGIVAGDGRMSTGPYPVAEAAPNVKGTFTGVAPGSTLFVYSTGEGLSILYAMEAWQHLYDNYDNLRPRIRVANHSFGESGGATYDPSSVEAAIVKKLVGKGITMVFSAGNSGGDGTTDTTSSYCDDPTPGVICVANYQDFDADSDPQGTGNRNSSVSSDSSRGLQSNQSTWPDIAAPGTWITAACIRGVEAVCASGVVDEIRWAPFYGTISGTSMAAPHVAGIAALLTQAKADITPARIEDVLEDAAHKFTAGEPYVADAQNSNATTSVDKGAGLADVPRALKALAVRSAGGNGGGVKQGTPTIAIGSPAAGARMPVPGFTASGTASDAFSVTAPPVQRILDGEGGDYSQVGAADIVALSVQETLGGSGLTYRLTVRDASDLGPTGSVSYRVWQNVNGLPFVTNVVLNSAGAAPGTGTAVATSASLSGNTITFFIPYTKVGKPPAGSPVHNVQMASYVGVIQDYAPSPNPSTGIELNTRPMFGKPFTVWRPVGKTPAATVQVQVDSAAPVAAMLTGSSPSYGWSTVVGRLTRGTHTLKATLYLGGVEKATATTSFVAR